VKILNQVKTHAVCRIPLVGCLLKASEEAGISEDWQPVNQEQEEFKRHLDASSQLSLLSSDEFDSMASTKEDEVNKWLSDKGFTIKCPAIQKGGFATASMVKFLVEWMEEASRKKLHGQNGELYDCTSFSLSGKKITVENKQWSMADIPTEDENTQVFLAMTDEMEEIGDEDLLTLAQNLQTSYGLNSSLVYEGVDVPMLDLNIETSQDWISGIRSDGWFVSSCVQQFILKFNEKGAVTKSAAAITISECCIMPLEERLFFNKPFLLWFSRNGITYPVFLSVCGYDCWKEPSNLD